MVANPIERKVLLPVLDERDNVADPAPRLGHALRGLGCNWEVIVVVGGSSDGQRRKGTWWCGARTPHDLGRADSAALTACRQPHAAWGPRWRALGPPLILALAPFAYYWRATLGRVALMESDGFAFHLPFRLLAARYFEQGYWPPWNPAVLSGFPFLAAMQPALCYPTTWLFACLPPVAAMNLQVLISFSVAALGMYAYARALGCARLAASFAAVTFAFNGFMLQRAIGHLGLLLGLVWLPVVLWSLERLRQSLRARFVIVGAGAPKSITQFDSMPARRNSSGCCMGVGTTWRLHTCGPPLTPCWICPYRRLVPKENASPRPRSTPSVRVKRVRLPSPSDRWMRRTPGRPGSRPTAQPRKFAYHFRRTHQGCGWPLTCLRRPPPTS